jgi:predicted metal-dependent phosphoesterase TrpH
LLRSGRQRVREISLLIDLHAHSYPKSDDSFMSVDDLVDAAKRLGLDGICLTDHDSFWSLDEIRPLVKRHNFLVLPGVELNTDAGHILVFGLERYVFGLHKPAFVRKLVDRQRGVMIAAHPYRRRFLEEPGREPEARAEMLGRACQDRFFRCCDAIEGINGRGTPLENQFSQDLRDQLGINSTAGSDAHRLEQLGTAATRFQKKINGLADLIEEIRAGRFESVDLRGPHPRPLSQGERGD